MRTQPKPGHGSANPADALVCNKHTTAVCYSPAYTKNNTKPFFSKSLCTSVPVHEGTLPLPGCLHPRSPQGSTPPTPPPTPPKNREKTQERRGAVPRNLPLAVPRPCCSARSVFLFPLDTRAPGNRGKIRVVQFMQWKKC